VFGDAGALDGRAERALEDGFVEVVAVEVARFRVAVLSRCGEDPLPWPLARGTGELSHEAVWELDVSTARGEVLAVKRGDLEEVLAQGCSDVRG
jgi:hypothetical protein